MHWVQL